MSTVRTCLWFAEGGLEAAEFYVSLLPDSQIEGDVVRSPDTPPTLVDFTLAGVPFQILTGGPQFPQTEAASISVTTEDQAETDRLWDALLGGGGSESMCGWCKDRWGVSWQIIPRRLRALLAHPDRGAAERAMQAMLQMRRIDIAAIESAAADAA